MRPISHFRGNRRWTLIGTLTVVVMAFGIASAFGILSGSPSNFESNDGNMIVAPNSTNNDWATVDGTCTPSTTQDCTSGSFVHLVDAVGQTDDSFDPGQKMDTVCPDVQAHGNPNKDDFTHIASYSETQSSAPFHTFLYGATIRVAANGNASENVELKSGKNGQCPNGSPLLARSAGDKLIAIDYLGGGSNVNFNVLTWIETSNGYDPTPNNPGDEIAGTCFVGNNLPPCWSSTVKALTQNAAEGSTNTATIEAQNNSISGERLIANKFAEFGVDLVAAGIIPPNTCVSFPQTVWESRSAGSSFTSSPKDMSIEDNAISNCGSIKIIKQTNPRGIDQKFSFTSNLPQNTDAGGVACTVGGDDGVALNGDFCLNDANNAGKTLGSTAAAQNSVGNTVTETNLFPGTYTVTEGANPTGFVFDSATCTGGTTSVNGKVVTITLGFNDNVVCVYQNNQQLGAIQVSKESIKASVGALDGAKFRICTNDGPYNTGPDNDQNPCVPAKTGSDDLGTTNGKACIDGLAFGDYYVSEKSPPLGYAVDDTTVHKVTVDNNAKCSDDPFVGETILFKDTPLTDVTVEAKAQVADATASRIQCLDSANAHVGDSPDPDDANGQQQFADPAKVTATGLKPGTYTCTVVIDP
jgi:Prealbumin-like fold domain